MKISSAAIALATVAGSATTAAAASEVAAVTRLRNTNVQNYKSLISSATTNTERRDQSIVEDDVGSLSMSLSFVTADGLTSTTAPATATETTMSIPTSVAPTVTPTNLYICGGDYTDASTNFCTNPTCPTGDGCFTGQTCFAIPYASCSDVDPGFGVGPELGPGPVITIDGVSMSMSMTTMAPSLTPETWIANLFNTTITATAAPVAAVTPPFDLSMSMMSMDEIVTKTTMAPTITPLDGDIPDTPSPSTMEPETIPPVGLLPPPTADNSASNMVYVTSCLISSIAIIGLQLL